MSHSLKSVEITSTNEKSFLLQVTCSTQHKTFVRQEPTCFGNNFYFSNMCKLFLSSTTWVAAGWRAFLTHDGNCRYLPYLTILYIFIITKLFTYCWRNSISIRSITYSILYLSNSDIFLFFNENKLNYICSRPNKAVCIIYVDE